MQSTMNVHGRVADYKLGRLDPEQEREFLRHVGECDECAETLRLLERAGQNPTRAASKPRFASELGVPNRTLITIVGIVILCALGFKLQHRSLTATYARGFTAFHGARVALKEQGGSGEILTLAMPPAPAGYRYEVYVLTDGTHKPVATGSFIHLNGSGEGGVQVPGGIDDVRAVALYQVAAAARAGGGAATPVPVASINVSSGR